MLLSGPGRGAAAGLKSRCGGTDHPSPGVPSVRGPESVGAFQQPRCAPAGEQLSSQTQDSTTSTQSTLRRPAHLGVMSNIPGLSR